MDGGFLSGGVIILVAAMLWLIYLVPSWVRDSQFSASERNAIRLQQTLRVLAETSEVPEAVRLEATAREVAAQRKILKQLEAESKATADAAARVELAKAERARREAEARAVAAEAAARTAEAAARSAQRNARAARMARSRRRARLMATTILGASVVGLVFGTSAMIASGTAFLFVASVVTSLVSLTALSRMSAIAHRAAAPVSVAGVAAKRTASELYEYAEPVEAAAVETSWTPTPIPKPLYLSEGSSAASELAKADAYAELRRAALAEAMASRAEQLQPEVPTLTPRRPVEEEAPAAIEEPQRPSRFASMGVIDEGEIATSGHALLQRRRAAS
ncbi:large exoprotein [Plantibacter sp. Mn2098]|uniref:large exoprotein n=1 Tax=Plantibacter sp. Mn2098 TaxID=3395266 RepID=UPI003BD09725